MSSDEKDVGVKLCDEEHKTYKNRLLHALKYNPDVYNLEDFDSPEEFDKACVAPCVIEDYISVQKVVWAEMTGQDVDKCHVKAMIRVLTDLPASSLELWRITDNLEYCPTLKAFVDSMSRTTTYIANQRLWKVYMTFRHVDLSDVDPDLLSAFEELYEQNRQKDSDRYFRRQNSASNFTVCIRDLPIDIVRKLKAATVVHGRDDFLRGQFELAEGQVLEFSFDTFGCSYSEMRTPTIRFEKYASQ